MITYLVLFLNAIAFTQNHLHEYTVSIIILNGNERGVIAWKNVDVYTHN